MANARFRSSELPKQLHKILHRARTLEPSTRRVFLSDICGYQRQDAGHAECDGYGVARDISKHGAGCGRVSGQMKDLYCCRRFCSYTHGKLRFSHAKTD
jgi:hypothetical protein